MKFSKNLLTSAVTASVVALSGVQVANAEIELGSGMNVTGFLDMSFVYTDADGSPSERVFGVDQFEMDFSYTGSDGVSAMVNIEYGESGDDSGADETFVEEAYIAKQMSDQFSVKAGRFLSYSGWETEEPTGLFQYSAVGEDVGGNSYGGEFYGGYQQGVSAYFAGEKVDFMASFVNDAFNGVENDASTVGTEIGVAVHPSDALTAKLFYITNDDSNKYNFWTSYVVSNYTFALEYNMSDNADDSEADGYLLMANYAADSFGFTVRYHAWSKDDAAGNSMVDTSGITLAPSFAIGDNLLIVAEYRMDTDDVADADTNSFALEALFTF